MAAVGDLGEHGVGAGHRLGDRTHDRRRAGGVVLTADHGGGCGDKRQLVIQIRTAGSHALAPGHALRALGLNPASELADEAGRTLDGGVARLRFGEMHHRVDRALGFADIGDAQAIGAGGRGVGVGLRIAQGQPRHRLRVQALDVQHQIAAHRQTHPDGLGEAGLADEIHIGVGHAVERLGVGAVLRGGPGLFGCGDRAFAGAGHIRRPDRESRQTGGVRADDELGRAIVPQVVVDREGVHEHNRDAFAVAVDRGVQFHGIPLLLVSHSAHANARCTMRPWPPAI